VNIYKNFLRDVRIYFNEAYSTFLEAQNFDPRDYIVKNSLFPILIREYVRRTFDSKIINSILEKSKDKFSKRKLYFVIASFI